MSKSHWMEKYPVGTIFQTSYPNDPMTVQKTSETQLTHIGRIYTGKKVPLTRFSSSKEWIYGAITFPPEINPVTEIEWV